MVLRTLLWGSLTALAWTHVGYPLGAAFVAATRRRRVEKADILPSVALVVAAHN